MALSYGARPGAGHSTVYALAPQPTSQGIQYPARVFALSGVPVRQGAPFIDLTWRGDIERDAALAILANFGLVTLSGGAVTAETLYAETSVCLPKTAIDRDAWAVYSGVAFLPEVGEGLELVPVMDMWRNLTVRVTELDYLTDVTS
jgi:hypothetical protein